MPGTEVTISRAARDLQSAANKLALMVQNRDRDRILAAVFLGHAKGQRAAARLEASAQAVESLECEVRRLRAGLALLLDQVLPEALEPPPLDLETEPPTKKRKKRK